MKSKLYLFKDPILRQVMLLAAISLFGFLLNLIINSYLLNISEQYSNEVNNQLNKKELGTFLHNRLIKVKSSIQELLMHDDSRVTSKITKEIDKNILEINDILQVLGKGGYFIQSLPVNFYQNDFIKDSIVYKAEESKSYNLEIIDITPKIIELKNLSKKMAQLKTRSFNQPTETETISKSLIILYKEADTYLQRAFENSNRIFHETQEEYKLIKSKKTSSLKRMKYVKTIWMIVISSLTLFLLIIILKKIIVILERRKTDQEKIIKNQASIEKILDTIPVGFIIFDQKRKVQRINKQAALLFDSKADDTLKGKSCRDLFVNQDDYICPFLTNSKTIANNELKIRTSTGKHKTVIKNATLINLDDKKVVLETFIDISDRKEIESQLIKAKEIAILATQEKSKFLASMSHEIRTPLNGIIGMSSLLEKTKLSDKQYGYLDIIQISSVNLVSIITDILDFSKIEAGEIKLDLHSFSIKQEIENNMKVWSLKAEEKSISFIVEIDDNIPNYIIGDSTRIKQVVINLVSNAIKFTAKGFVKVQLKYLYKNNQTFIYFAVKDSGIGIKEDRIEKIFNAFSQTDSSITRKYGGTGLGLTISQELIELMNGQIGVSSEQGEGSVFWFEIPVSKGTKPSEKEVMVPQNNPDKQILKILLAEDNVINQRVASAIFNKLNYKIDIAINGKIATEMYAQDEYDLIFMDLQMPVMDGLTATKVILDIASKKNQQVFIAAMTANAMKEDKANCLKAGMCYFLSKPYKLEDIQEAINQYYLMKDNAYCK